MAQGSSSTLELGRRHAIFPQFSIKAVGEIEHWSIVGGRDDDVSFVLYPAVARLLRPLLCPPEILAAISGSPGGQ